MQIQPDVRRWEYGAIIWRNSAGLHRTVVERGMETKVPLDKLWAQVNWSSGGKIVAVIHSHPEDQMTGSVAQPVWTPLPNPYLPSSADF